MKNCKATIYPDSLANNVADRGLHNHNTVAATWAASPSLPMGAALFRGFFGKVPRSQHMVYHWGIDGSRTYGINSYALSGLIRTGAFGQPGDTVFYRLNKHPLYLLCIGNIAGYA